MTADIAHHDDSDWLRSLTERLHAQLRQTAAGMLAVGAMIAEAKERLGHGRFLAWVAAELPFTIRTVDRMMRATQQFGDQIGQRVHNFDVSALYLLSQPTVPEGAREMALGFAGEGKQITVKVAKAIIRESRPRPEPKKPAPPVAPANAADLILGMALRMLMPDGGERIAHLSLEARLDPEGDVLFSATYRPAGGAAIHHQGRNKSEVLGALVADLPRPADASPIDLAPHIAWCEARAVSVAREHGFSDDSQGTADLKQFALTTMLTKVGQFDVSRVGPGGDIGGAFRGWLCPTIQSECGREIERMRNGGLYNTKRGPAIRPVRFDEGERRDP